MLRLRLIEDPALLRRVTRVRRFRSVSGRMVTPGRLPGSVAERNVDEGAPVSHGGPLRDVGGGQLSACHFADEMPAETAAVSGEMGTRLGTAAS